MFSKETIRNQMRDVRNALSQEEVLTKSASIVEHIKSLQAYQRADVTMGFWPLAQEVHAILTEKHLLLPAVREGRIQPCTFTSKEELKQGPYAILEPTGPTIAPKNIDIVFVPGLAFTKQGHRLGYGRGYYDVFLASLSCTKVGLAFEEQLTDSIPQEPHDIPMDVIVTDKRVIHI